VKKAGVFVVAVTLGVGLLVGTAFAGDIPLPGQEIKGKLTDFGSLFVGGTPRAGLETPAIGDEDRSIFFITVLQDPSGAPQFWPTSVPATEELTGLFYDVYIGAIGVDIFGRVILDFVPAGTPIPGVPATPRIVRPDLVGSPAPAGSGGAWDAWLDQTPDWNTVLPGAPKSGPGAWIPWPGGGGVPHDDYPGASDVAPGPGDGADTASLWLYGTFIPLSDALLLPGVAVLEISVFPANSPLFPGTGEGRAKFNIQGGSASGMFETDGYGPGVDVTIKFDLSFPPDISASDLFGWGVRSEDPVLFRVVPEPATMLLFGSCLAGAFGFWRKRRAS